MKRTNSAIPALALSFALPATIHADTYDYEIGILYDAIRASSESGFAGVIGPVPFTFESDSDMDEIGLAGTWYFDGVAASKGPRGRAAFISRASTVSLSYTRGSGDTVSTVSSTDPAFPPSTNRSESTANRISAALRWVWSDSGWYGLAGLSAADLDGPGSIEFDAEAYSLGFGKYIGTQTALELTVVRQNSEASGPVIGGDVTSNEVAVGFVHIGSLGRMWQYGTDIILSTTGRGASDGSYSARLSLYPSRPLAFGIETGGALQDPGDASTSYGLFASWFPRERIELEARYGWLSLDEPADTDFDQYNFGVGVNFRF